MQLDRTATAPQLLRIVGKNARHQARGVYLCCCGAQFEALAYNVSNGHTKSCGCLKPALCRRARQTHQEARPQSVEYRVWAGMKARCSNPKSNNFSRYGGRGIRVCQQWLDSYDQFLKDVGRRPTPAHSLDRLDNDGHYEPGNVRWATPAEQARNRRSNHVIEFNGRRQCLQAWADELAISQTTLIERLEKWPVERALTTPKQS